jgi:hypothetical protein
MEELIELAEAKGGKAVPGETKPSFVIVPGNAAAKPELYIKTFLG